jgi:hypothetical protein
MANTLPQKTLTTLGGKTYRITALPAVLARPLLVTLTATISRAALIGGGGNQELAVGASLTPELFEQFYSAFEPQTEVRGPEGHFAPVTTAAGVGGPFVGPDVGDLFEIMEAHIAWNFQGFFDRAAALRAAKAAATAAQKSLSKS